MNVWRKDTACKKKVTQRLGWSRTLLRGGAPISAQLQPENRGKVEVDECRCRPQCPFWFRASVSLGYPLHPYSRFLDPPLVDQSQGLRRALELAAFRGKEGYCGASRSKA